MARPGPPGISTGSSTALPTSTFSQSPSPSPLTTPLSGSEKESVRTYDSSPPPSEPEPAWACRFDLKKARAQSQLALQAAAAAAADAKTGKATPDADVAIIGAGVAGCALAVALARQGRRVLLFEADLREPNRIVGELLQPGGVAALARLGLRHCVDGIDGIPTLGYNVRYLTDAIHLPYRNAHTAHIDDPDLLAGICFHHGRFIQQLRTAAQATENITFVEGSVADVVEDPRTRAIIGLRCVPAKSAGEANRRPDPLTFYAPLVVAANGYNSSLRKRYLTSTQPLVRSKFWGGILRDVRLEKPGHGHVFLSGEKPVLVYQIAPRETRILVDMPNSLPAEFKVPVDGEDAIAGPDRRLSPQVRYMYKRVLPTLPSYLRPAFLQLISEQSFSSMPNSWLTATKNTKPGLAFLGDSLNMRHPLTGGGMTVALKDVVLLSSLLERIPDFSNTREVLRVMSKWHTAREPYASVINTLAQALYSVFSDDDRIGTIFKEGCFDYLMNGDEYYGGPVGLLSGIAESKVLLIRNFFAVAFYAIQRSAWQTATRWAGLSALLDPPSGPTQTPLSAMGAPGFASSSEADAARAAGCPVFAGPGGPVAPAGHPSMSEVSSADEIPAICPMSSRHGEWQAAQRQTASGGMQVRPGPPALWEVLLRGIFLLLMFPAAWLGTAVPLLYRACVVIGPVIMKEVIA